MLTSPYRTFYRFGQGMLACATLLMLLLSLVACGGDDSKTSTTTASNSPLLVWVDATRLDGAKLYQKQHPNVKLNIVTVDRGTLPEKVLLFNRSNNGWPDVVFAEPELVAKVADKAHHYPEDLKPLVPQSVLDQFAPNSLAPCEADGKLYCLRNDLAQNVLWYNSKLMKQFGYTVPTTWEEYQALGLKLAKEHPGYVIGAFGDDQAMNAYFWSSQCPIKNVTQANSVQINLSDPKCTRAANMLDPLIKAGVIAKAGPFDPAFVKLGQSDKVLMLPAASWYGEYVFKPKETFHTPSGELSVALPPKWASDSAAYTGAQGGAAWAISSHSKNKRAAADMAIWMSTSNDYQASAPTFPAYLPAADAWAKTISVDKFYASNPYPVLKEAAGLIDPKWAIVRYDAETPFKTVVVAQVAKGQTVASTLAEFQKQVSQLAQASGYTVSNS